MSKKYNDKITQGTGFSNVKFECDYGLAILQKMGWTEGKGLGASENGLKECVQVKRRDESLGLGINQKEFKWNNNWWEKQFNAAIKGLKVEASSSSESSEDEEDLNNHPKIKKINKVEKKFLKKKISQETTEESDEKESEKSEKNNKTVEKD